MEFTTPPLYFAKRLLKYFTTYPHLEREEQKPDFKIGVNFSPKQRLPTVLFGQLAV
jgi:hypothetical protein